MKKTALTFTFFCSLSCFAFTVDKDLPGGNIAVEKTEGDEVFVHQDLRDTEGPWIYWAFRVTGAEGRTLTFSFTKSPAVGSRGAAVSFDRGKTWRWSDDLDKSAPRDELGDHKDWRSFVWTFGQDQKEVWFSQTIPYMPEDWETFLSRHSADRGTVFETSVLCQTKKGRDIPYARFGRLDGKARERLFVAARHHCGEATASFVVEGMLEAFFAKDELGCWLRENVELRVVPFVDLDGVVDGDQGKNRRPWDPARDYVDDRPQQFPQVAAIMKMLKDWKPTGVQDTHCPWLRGNWTQKWNTNEYCYQPRSRTNGPKAQVFGEIVERLSAGRMGYRVSDDIPFGCGWNAGHNFKQGRALNAWANETLPGLKFSTCWEIAFANQREKTLYPDDFRAFGRDVIAGWREYFETYGKPVGVGGIYPSLAYYNNEGECGTGAVVPWAGSLYVVTYAPHGPVGSSDKLYRISPDLTLWPFEGSVGGTPANRLIHRESNQLLIGTYLVDAKGKVRTVPIHTMPGRLTGAALHLEDPANKIYVTDMEEALYELDVHTLATRAIIRDGHNDKDFTALFKNLEVPPPAGWETAEISDLFGYHGKGTCSGFGKVFYANNGGYGERSKRDPTTPAGSLAYWKPGDRNWTLIRTNQFTEVTTRDGIFGNEHPDANPIWAMGWDANSVILTVTTDGEHWTDYRLPKGSHSYDGAHGWNTEWPRIREVGNPETLLATMHGTFWRFPADFRPGRAKGIRPRSNYLKVIGDFCAWNGKVVLGCDDSARNEFMNKRSVKGTILGPAKSQSNVWFVDPDKLDDLGPALGNAFVWWRQKAVKGRASDPYLFAGYAHKWAWVSDGTYSVETDADGSGAWEKVATVRPGGTDLSSFEGEWVRFVPQTDVESATVTLVLRAADGRSTASAAEYKSVALPVSGAALLHVNGSDPYALSVGVGEKGFKVDRDLCLSECPIAAKVVQRAAPLVTNAVVCEASSILYVDDKGNRWRLPYGSKKEEGKRKKCGEGRVCREVSTERDHFNAGGIYYELPAENAHGFAGVRPVATHNLPVTDYCSWRGLFALSLPGEIRFMPVDEMWRTGKVRGFGGPWKDTAVKAGEPSDAYLLNGFDKKTLTLVSDTDTTVTLEVDLTGWGDWVKSNVYTLKSGETHTEALPRAFGGYWVRCVSSVAATVTVQFDYE